MNIIIRVYLIQELNLNKNYSKIGLIIENLKVNYYSGNQEMVRNLKISIINATIKETQ